MKLIFFNLVFYCLCYLFYAQSLSENRYFVVDLSWNAELFNLKEEGNTENDRFSISVQDDGEFFSVDETTGIVRKNNDWGDEEREISFQVNINRQSGVFTQTIHIKMVKRMEIRYNTILLKNQPAPLQGTVWYWTRPGTVVMTVQAIDSDFHKDGKLIYELADNGRGRFGIDNLGNIYVKERKRLDGKYDLAVSVFSKGTIRTNNERTDVQPLTIFAGSLRPQFYKQKYDIQLEEKRPIGSNVATIEVKSFQSLRVSVSSNDLDTTFFQLIEVSRKSDMSTYEIRNRKMLVYGRSDIPYVFKFVLSAREEVSNFVTTVEAVITLVDVNEPPFFTVERYEDYDVNPSSWSGIELTVYDNDFGNKDPNDYGDQISWSIDDTQNFELTDEKKASIHERSWTIKLKMKQPNSVRYGDTPDHTKIVKVTARDNGEPPMNSTIDCLIRLQKMNSEPPIMEPRDQIVKLSKSIEKSNSNPIYFVQAYDPDGMAADQDFSFSLVNNFNLFDINTETGALYLIGSLTNPNPTYDLEIQIAQGGLSSIAGKVIIQLVDINQPPKFDNCRDYMNTPIKENREPGEIVTTVKATDTDLGPAGQLTYTFVRRDQGDEQFFSINETTGLVTSKIKFNREAPPNGRTSLRLTVQAKDKGKPPQATNCFFFVKIGDENDIRPKFDVASEGNEFFAPHDLSRGAFIAQLYAFDTDEFDTNNAIIEYENTKIDPECEGCFNFRSLGDKSLKTFNIEADTLRDQEGRYEITITATDSGTPRLTATTTITVIITKDQNNYPPVIQDINSLTSTKSISETILGGQVITSGRATNHQNDQLLFGIRSDLIPLLNSEKTFGLNSFNNGSFEVIFRNGKTLDREVQSKYLLIVSITGRKSLNIRIPVVLNDENNKSPEFQGMDSSDNYQVLLPQNTGQGEEILSFIATDEDSSKNNNNKVSYEIDGCTTFELSKCRDKFTVSSERDISGYYFGSLKLNEPISPEEIGNQFKIDIIAKDGSNSAFPGQNGPNRNKKSVRLDITGISPDSPKFPSGNYVYETDELSKHGLSIANITAASDEQYDQYVEKTYSITGGNDNRWFTVNPTTGNIYIAGNGLISIDDLQGTSRKVSLEYKVFDGAVQSDSIYVNITINDVNKFAPYVTSNFAETVDYEEMSSPAGKVVYSFESKDPDVKRSSESNYDEHCVSIQEKWKDYFSVQKDTSNGAVNKWKIVLRQPLGRDYYDGFDRWVINVVVQDECENPSTSKIGYGTFTVKPIDINNHQPRFTPRCLLLNVDEEKQPNDNVKVFTTCTYDVDSGINGEIDVGSYQAEGSRFFTFNSQILQVGEKIPIRLSDRLETLSYTFPVKVRDRSNNDPASSIANVTVYVNDINNHQPEFQDNNPISIEMNEEMPINSVVYTLMAKDIDIDANALRQYSVSGSNLFYMDSLYSQGGGALRVRDRIDYDNGQRSFQLNIEVKHPTETFTSSKEVNVQVLPINDNAPEITSDSGQNSMIIREDTNPSNDVLATFTGKDDDGDSFDWFIDYEVSDPSRRFNIEKRNNDKADLKLIRNLDRETISNFSLRILAIDNGSPPQTGSLTFSVTVGDVNDNAPELIPDRELIVPKSVNIGQELDGVIRVEDPDSDDNSEPFFLEGTLCSSGNTACESFNILKKADDTYRVTTKKSSYNRFDKKEYYLPVIMRDSGNPSKTGTSTLTIVVESLNENKQEKGATKYVTVYNFKYRLPDSSIGTPYSVDKDDWDLKDKKFDLLNHKEIFEVVNDASKPDHGHVKLKAGTKADEYELEIRITDTTRNADVVVSKMVVKVIYLDEQAIKYPGSMTLTGITAEKFIEGSENKRDKLKGSLASILQTSTENVEIFSIYNSGKDTTQILYAAHGSPWYDKSRLDGLAILNKEKLESDAGVKISEIPINECDGDNLCYTGGCVTEIEIEDKEFSMINTNFSSQTQVKAKAVGICKCPARSNEKEVERCTSDFCMNNGTCIDKFTNPEDIWGEPLCKCLPGFDGKRCQQLDHSFNGNGFAWYESLALCEEDVLSIDIVTNTRTGLIFYQGPLSKEESKDYLALELNDGKPKFTGQYESNKIILDVPNSKNLADGKWHNIQISKIPTDRKLIRWSLTVDNCKDADVDENIENSTENDSGCKQSIDLKLSRSYLDNINPLQLGGRKSTNYPSGITKNGFNGCMKNIRHNGVVRDLYTGRRREQTSTENGCPAITNKCSDCGTNATCNGDLTSSNAICVCKPGFTSPPSCTEEVDTRKFKEKAYISWNLQSPFNNSLSSTQTRRNQRLQLRFRTRKEDGTLFMASSFSTLEQIILSVTDGTLKLQYDLGSGYNTLALPQIKVSDGHWHTIVFERFGNGGILTLDDGDAPRYFVQNLQTDSHRLIAVDGSDISSGAMLQRKEFHNLPTATNYFEKSCISDIRYQWSDNDPVIFPLNENPPNSVVSFSNRVNTEQGCPSGVVCADPSCPSGAPCIVQWESTTCNCGIGKNYTNEVCATIDSCIVPQCYNGGLCAERGAKWFCHCPENYSGDRCGTKAEGTKDDSTSFATGGIVGIILAILLALVILLVLAVWLKKRKEPEKVIIDHPETDENEFCYNYTEEGGGEEDTANFSTAELRKAAIEHPHEPRKIAEINTGYAPDDSPYHISPVSPFGPDGKPKNLGDFLNDRLAQADNDPTAPPYDTVREYEYEGGASQAGSLSSLASGSTDASIDYEPYMQGPRFDKLRDIYSGNDDPDNFPVNDSFA